MQIKTLTTYNVYNYGASLQAYALMNYLSNLGNDVQIINYQPNYLTRKYDYTWVNPESKMSRYKLTRILYRCLKYIQRLTTLKRKKKFDEFRARYLKETITEYKTFEELQGNPPNADLYLVGSDQVWNVFYEAGRDPAFYLDFVQRGKKASFAASFSFLDIDAVNKHKISKYLASFDAVSVREYQGLDILKAMHVMGTWVLDPVFLLKVDDWKRIMVPFQKKEKYILVYDFERNSELKIFVQKYAKVHNLKIYSINDTYPLFYANKNFNSAGPLEFISLIYHCDAFVSNSFHGTAFSIMFNKPVFVFNRYRHKVNSRMESIMKLFKLERYIITNISSSDELLYSKFDYTSINSIMDIERKKTKEFLAQLL